MDGSRFSLFYVMGQHTSPHTVWSDSGSSLCWRGPATQIVEDHHKAGVTDERFMPRALAGQS